MQYKPHEYQQYATQFILDHPVAAILLDMGLGKRLPSRLLSSSFRKARFTGS